MAKYTIEQLAKAYLNLDVAMTILARKTNKVQTENSPGVIFKREELKAVDQSLNEYKRFLNDIDVTIKGGN